MEVTPPTSARRAVMAPIASLEARFCILWMPIAREPYSSLSSSIFDQRRIHETQKIGLQGGRYITEHQSLLKG